MLRLFLFTFFLSITNVILAQEWELFPVNQKNYYQRQASDSAITCRFTDFTYKKNNEKIFFFSNGLFKYCHPDSITNFYEPKDSIIKNDSVHIFIRNNDTIYFYHNAEPGDSWFIPFQNWSPNSNRLKITCESKHLGQLLGAIQDSVRSFSIKTYIDTVPLPTSPLNNKKFILSKNFGLIEAVFFHQDYNYVFLDNAIYVPAFERLIGIQNDTISIGYAIPPAEDFLPYQVGDIYKWYNFVDNVIFYPDKEYWYRDTIIQVSISGDTFCYKYNRHMRVRYMDSTGIVDYTSWLNNQASCFHISHIAEILNGQTHYINTANHPRWSSNSSKEIWQTSSFRPSQINGKESVAFSFSTDFNYLDTALCQTIQLTDNGESFTFSTIIGLTEYNRYMMTAHDRTVLIGFNSAAAGAGGDYFPIGIEELKNKTATVKLYPIPATDKIYLDGINFHSDLEYAVFSSDGKLIISASTSENYISVGNIPSGLYFLEIRNKEGQKSYTKFIKN